MDRWMERPLWGLPLRMVLTEPWHRAHFVAIGVGAAIMSVGMVADAWWIRTIGAILVAPSLLTLIVLFPLLALTLLALSRVMRD